MFEGDGFRFKHRKLIYMHSTYSTLAAFVTHSVDRSSMGL